MIRSMTGFGIAESDTEKFICKVELKSLNGKFFELNIRMPRNWQHKELDVRNELNKSIERGSATLSINLQYKNAEDKALPINHDVAAFYLAELEKISSSKNISTKDLFTSIFDFPNIVSSKENENSENDWNQILLTVKNAFVDFDSFRKKEGEMLCVELENICLSIEDKLNQIQKFESKRIESIKQRITKEIEQTYNSMIDKNRFEQELIYYIEKLDISEEKVRLKQHCDFFIETLNKPSSGKKLNFIAQEIGREINTIGSKSYDANMQRLVVEMKDELEKMKEQINNVL